MTKRLLFDCIYFTVLAILVMQLCGMVGLPFTPFFALPLRTKL